MTTETTNVGLRDRLAPLAKIKPWIYVAAVLGIVIVLYSGYQARRYRAASSDLEKSTSEIIRLGPQAVSFAGPQEALEEEFVERKRLLEEWASVFRIGATRDYKLSIRDNSTTTSVEIADVNITEEAAGWVDLDITPGVEYPFQVHRTGGARHYKLGSEHPELTIAHTTTIRYLEDATQEWRIRVSEGEEVRLEIATERKDEDSLESTQSNRGAFQATQIEVTLFDSTTEAELLGPTTTELVLNKPTIITYSNTSTDRDLVIRLTADGHFRMRKIGGDDERLYMLPCPKQGEEAPEPDEFSCPIGIFAEGDQHDWTLLWTGESLPEGGKVRLKIGASSKEALEGGAFLRSDAIYPVITATAEEVGVTLGSLTVLDTKPLIERGIEYQTLGARFALTADTHGLIYDFLSRLHRKAPGVSVTSIALEGFGGEPSAQLQVKFYLAPEPPSK